MQFKSYEHFHYKNILPAEMMLDKPLSLFYIPVAGQYQNK